MNFHWTLKDYVLNGFPKIRKDFLKILKGFIKILKRVLLNFLMNFHLTLKDYP